MAKQLSVVWDLEPHTAKKHEILRRYFQAWLPIMAKWNGRIVYIDGFSGPGRYKSGEDGSPVIVLKTARDHSCPLQAELVCLFIEENKARYEYLIEVLKEIAGTLPKNIKYLVFHGEFNEQLIDVFRLIEDQRKKVAPTLVFIDPFGFSHTPFHAIQKILSSEKCEVLINFMYEEVNRFLSVPAHASDYDELFGTPDWRNVLTISGPQERRRAIHNIYLGQLRKSAKHVRSFEMLNSGNTTDYFLFFATNNLKGLEKMKEAMWQADDTGSFTFSDYTDSRGLMSLFSKKPDYETLRSLIKVNFAGSQVAIEAVEEWVIAETSFLRTHIKRNVLKPMESEGELSVIKSSPKRRRGEFSAGTVIKFS
jgi:three-Cys-motif partner protein